MGFIQQLKQVKKKKAVRIAFSLFLILCSSLLQTYVIQSFIISLRYAVPPTAIIVAKQAACKVIYTR